MTYVIKGKLRRKEKKCYNDDVTYIAFVLNNSGKMAVKERKKLFDKKCTLNKIIMVDCYNSISCAWSSSSDKSDISLALEVDISSLSLNASSVAYLLM